MSEGGHHHGGDMGGQQGFQPGMFPPHETITITSPTRPT